MMMQQGTPEPRPILFLDVDGVLHPLLVEDRDGKLSEEHCFSKDCMLQLSRIVAETSCEIVVSSSWRLFNGPREKLATALAAYGLGFKRWTTAFDIDGSRASQILNFIDRHAPDPRQQWAVLDDEDVTLGRGSMMMQVVVQHFVQTDGKRGLSAELADKVIAILKGVDDEEEEG